MDPLPAYFITAFISVLAIINPLSTIGLYLSLTQGKNAERNKIAFQTSLFAFCVLVFFSLSGFFIFQIYGITVEAFRIAGGAVLMVIGMRMLFPANAQSDRHSAGKQIFIFPLGVPMTSGPGAITTVVVLASQATNLWYEIALWAAIFLACAINFIVLRFSAGIYNWTGKAGIEALVKIMGLLVCAVAVQFVITGILAAFPILAGVR
ncbi:MAG: MarC family protein [Candidatus Micrarchaeia archaeon]